MSSSKLGHMDRLQMFSLRDLDVQSKMTLTSILAVSVVLIFFYKLNAQGRANDLRLLPGPRAWPFVGNLGLLGPLAHLDLAKLAQKYGPLFRLRLGSIDSIIVSSPEIAKEILKTHDHVFASRPSLIQGKILSYNWQDGFTGPYGPYTRYVRKIFTLELLTAKRLKEFQSLRKQEVMSMLHAVLEDCNTGNVMRPRILFGKLTKNIITQMAFGKAFFGQNSGAYDIKESTSFIEILKELSRLYGVRSVGDFIPMLRFFDVQGYKQQMRAVVRKNDVFFDKVIEEHRQMLRQKNSKQPSQSDRMDLVDVLLTRPSEGNDGKPLTDTQIKAIITIAIGAGTETSSSALEWAMAELLRNPATLKKAQEELDAVVGRDRLVEETDIPNLEYIRAVVMETFRMHPILPTLIPRCSMESCEVAGYHIPANVIVFVNTWAMGRDPAVWERASEFEPERFLKDKKDVINGQGFEFLPFGSGRRVCPGRNLGLLVVEYALAASLQSFKWVLPQGVEPQDLDVIEAPGLTTYKAVPLDAVASPRIPLHIINKDFACN